MSSLTLYSEPTTTIELLYHALIPIMQTVIRVMGYIIGFFLDVVIYPLIILANQTTTTTLYYVNSFVYLIWLGIIVNLFVSIMGLFKQR